MFGGLNGLEYSLEADESLSINNVALLFDHYLNTCPMQGSRTIRTEVCVRRKEDRRRMVWGCTGGERGVGWEGKGWSHFVNGELVALYIDCMFMLVHILIITRPVAIILVPMLTYQSSFPC